MEDLNAALALDPSNALALRFRGGVSSAVGRYQVRLDSFEMRASPG